MSSNHINTDTLQVVSDQPYKQQDCIDALQDNSITEKKVNTQLPSKLICSKVVITKDRVYLLGGWNGDDSISTIHTTTINEDGTLGEWVIDTPLPIPVHSAQVITIKNRVYLLGGVINDTLTANVYTTTINEDGTLGVWTNAASLPKALCHSQSVITKNRIYLLGGFITSAISNVYTATINEDGTLGEWVTDAPLPKELCNFSVIVTKNRVYLLGGLTCEYIANPTVYIATINDDGTLGEWVIGVPLPEPLANSHAITIDNRAYLLDAVNETNPISTVYTTTTNDDGTLGEWVTDAPLPTPLSCSHAVVTKNKIYLLGGCVFGKIVSAVYTADINSDGTLNEWVVDTPLPKGLSHSQTVIVRNHAYTSSEWGSIGT